MHAQRDTSTGSAALQRPEPFLVLDVFTREPLAGNQLGVFTDAAAIPPELMQRLARELGFSETVFVLPGEEHSDARLRIFTPSRELPFAGHPVLGASFAVGAQLERDQLRLQTGLGVVPVELRREGGAIAFGSMRQLVPEWRTYEHEAELLSALGVERSGLPVEAYANGPLHVYVELESEDAVARLRPDMRALAALDCCANCFAGSGRRFKTRMFAPELAFGEDPATGSAAGPLAVHLSRHGRIAFGEEIEISQGAEVGRPSLLYASAHGSRAAIERVQVGGSAVTVARGEFILPR
jgi:trans-2,3-dihydro-3-hydroxyanthranilate isomerase